MQTNAHGDEEQARARAAEVQAAEAQADDEADGADEADESAADEVPPVEDAGPLRDLSAAPRDAERHDRPQVKLFLEGRYRKLSRDLPQTVFFCPECKGHPRRRRKCARCEGWAS